MFTVRAPGGRRPPADRRAPAWARGARVWSWTRWVLGTGWGPVCPAGPPPLCGPAGPSPFGALGPPPVGPPLGPISLDLHLSIAATWYTVASKHWSCCSFKTARPLRRSLSRRRPAVGPHSFAGTSAVDCAVSGSALEVNLLPSGRRWPPPAGRPPRAGVGPMGPGAAWGLRAPWDCGAPPLFLGPWARGPRWAQWATFLF